MLLDRLKQNSNYKEEIVRDFAHDVNLDINELIENNDKQLKEDKQELGILESNLKELSDELLKAKYDYSNFKTIFNDFNSYLKHYLDYQYEKKIWNLK